MTQNPTRYNLVQGFRGGIMQKAVDGKYVLFHAYETDNVSSSQTETKTSEKIKKEESRIK